VNIQEKGKRFERRIAKTLSQMFGQDIRRTPNSGGLSLKGDIMTVQEGPLKRFHYELKHHETVKIWDFIKQSQADADPGKIPLVIFTRNQADDYVTLKFDDFFNLVKECEDMRLLYKEKQKPMSVEEFEKDFGVELHVIAKDSVYYAEFKGKEKANPMFKAELKSEGHQPVMGHENPAEAVSQLFSLIEGTYSGRGFPKDKQDKRIPVIEVPKNL